VTEGTVHFVAIYVIVFTIDIVPKPGKPLGRKGLKWKSFWRSQKIGAESPVFLRRNRKKMCQYDTEIHSQLIGQAQ
jgi:hypothetical protein